MSSRITYANGAAVLTDFVLECWQNLPSKFDGDGVAITADEAAIDFIAQWLADGNSMQRLCETYALNWGVVAAWIRKSPERDSRYRQAMADRSAFRKERLLDGWWETAQMVPDDAATHGDVHKAREALAKSEGVFSDASKVQIDTNITIVHESA